MIRKIENLIQNGRPMLQLIEAPKVFVRNYDLNCYSSKYRIYYSSYIRGKKYTLFFQFKKGNIIIKLNRKSK